MKIIILSILLLLLTACTIQSPTTICFDYNQSNVTIEYPNQKIYFYRIDIDMNDCQLICKEAYQRNINDCSSYNWKFEINKSFPVYVNNVSSPQIYDFCTCHIFDC